MSGVIRHIVLVLMMICVPSAYGEAAPPFDDSVKVAPLPPSEPCLCGSSRAVLSPDGSMFALLQTNHGTWNVRTRLQPWGQLHIIDSACFARERYITGCEVGGVSIDPPFAFDAYWSQSGQELFVVSNDTLLVGMSVDRVGRKVRPLPGAINLEHAQSAFLNVRGPTASRTVVEEWRRRVSFRRDRYRFWRAGAEGVRYKVLSYEVSGEPVGAIGWIDGKLDTAAVTDLKNGGTERLPMSQAALFGSTWASAPVMYRSMDGHHWIFGGGEALRRETSSDGVPRWTPAGDSRGFAKREIVDSSNGRLIGVHTETDVHWIREDSRFSKLTSAIRAQLTGASVIHTLTVAGGQRSALMLIQDLARGGVYVHLRWDPRRSDWVSSTLVCPASNTVPGISAQTLDVGDPGWPVPARIYRQAGAKRLVIHLHGGPTATLARDGTEVSAVDMLRRGHDYVTFDYSGAIGVGMALSGRVSKGEPENLLRDAALMSRFLKTEGTKYDKISLLADSFGAVFVPSVMAQIGSRVDRVLLVGPAVKHRSRETAKGEPSGSMSHQQALERYFLGLHGGAGERWESFLASQWGDFPLDDRYLVVQGLKDDISMPGDIPNIGQARVDLVPGGHETLASDLWPCWMDVSCPQALLDGLGKSTELLPDFGATGR